MNQVPVSKGTLYYCKLQRLQRYLSVSLMSLEVILNGQTNGRKADIPEDDRISLNNRGREYVHTT